MASPDTRRFHLGDVLSVVTGVMLSPRSFAGVHELVEWLASEPVWTHQIPRVCDEARQPLLAQHPALADVAVPDFAEPLEQTVPAWLAEQVARLGEYLDVAPLRADQHTSVNPITEMAAMRPDAQVIAVVAPEARGGTSGA